MNPDQLTAMREKYRASLLDDIIPFWTRHAPDHESGGFLHYLDRDGSVLSTDKAVWLQARATWLFAHLFNVIAPEAEWLELSDHGRDFVLNKCFDTDGRMFFSTTRDGKPLRKRRYFFSEIFSAIGLAENALAYRDPAPLQVAENLFRNVVRLYREPDATTPPKTIPSTRMLKSHSMPMMLLITGRTIRNAARLLGADPALEQLCAEVISDAALTIQQQFYKPEFGCLFERVLIDGSIHDAPEGRLVNPGHGMETCWFLLEEAHDSGDMKLRDFATKVLLQTLEKGWDYKYGGLLYFLDAKGKPAEPLEHDMKLWWAHAEALCATICAYRHTRDPEFLRWHELVSDYTFSNFPDPEFGEWYGYLHRDGSISSQVKGNMWKGPFHIPRALIECTRQIAAIE
jgi:N-acylglucosamine 2-epimerase